MDFERSQYLGQREQKKNELKQLELSITGLRGSIRMGLNPHIEIEEIKGDQVAQQTIELAEKQIRYLKIKDQIRNLNRSLGE